MAEERQPPNIVEGATTGDVEDELQPEAKSAEDRKAAAALAKLDARPGDDNEARNVDHDAVNKAISNLAGGGASGGAKAVETKKVKVDAADVALLTEHLDMAKPKATELLKQHDGDAVKAMTAFIQGQ